MTDDDLTRLLLAQTIANCASAIGRERHRLLDELRGLDQLVDQANGDRTALLLIESRALHLEADLKWLDLLEQRTTTTA